jgi:hypothetical protein
MRKTSLLEHKMFQCTRHFEEKEAEAEREEKEDEDIASVLLT